MAVHHKSRLAGPGKLLFKFDGPASNSTLTTGAVKFVVDTMGDDDIVLLACEERAEDA